MGLLFLLAEVLLIGMGLLALGMLTNIWYALLTGSVAGVVAVERAAAQHTSKLASKLAERARR